MYLSDDGDDFGVRLLTLMVSVSAIFCSNKAFSKVLRGKDSQSPTTTRSISLKLIHVRLDKVVIIYYYTLKSNSNTCQSNELLLLRKIHPRLITI